jgi:hypothetical protein
LVFRCGIIFLKGKCLPSAFSFPISMIWNVDMRRWTWDESLWGTRWKVPEFLVAQSHVSSLNSYMWEK